MWPEINFAKWFLYIFINVWIAVALSWATKQIIGSSITAVLVFFAAFLILGFISTTVIIRDATAGRKGATNVDEVHYLEVGLVIWFVAIIMSSVIGGVISVIVAVTFGS